jgi:squalene synthase HpnC
MPSSASELQAAYALCRRRAFGHYENFPVASWLLPARARDAVAALYAFARQADDFADEPEFGSASQRRKLLGAWKRKLRQAPREGVFIALQDAVRRFQLPLQLLEDLISAFQQDCSKARYANFDELADYARRSANPVGRLVLRICGQETAASDLESDAICSALQYVNFWQDLGSDVQGRRRFYLPQDEMKRFGVSELDLRAPRASKALRDLLRFQVRRVEAFFALGEALPSRLEGGLAAEIRLTLLGGRRILEKIRAQDYDCLVRRPKLGFADLGVLGWRFCRGALQ